MIWEILFVGCCLIMIGALVTMFALFLTDSDSPGEMVEKWMEWWRNHVH
jgi:hypothetical protein